MTARHAVEEAAGILIHPVPGTLQDPLRKIFRFRLRISRRFAGSEAFEHIFAAVLRTNGSFSDHGLTAPCLRGYRDRNPGTQP
jgi:hypothetical protein